jgi:hypothetical protein
MKRILPWIWKAFAVVFAIWFGTLGLTVFGIPFFTLSVLVVIAVALFGLLLVFLGLGSGIPPS